MIYVNGPAIRIGDRVEIVSYGRTAEDAAGPISRMASQGYFAVGGSVTGNMIPGAAYQYRYSGHASRGFDSGTVKAAGAASDAVVYYDTRPVEGVTDRALDILGVLSPAVGLVQTAGDIDDTVRSLANEARDWRDKLADLIEEMKWPIIIGAIVLGLIVIAVILVYLKPWAPGS